MRCEEIRDLTAELALGIADGEERAEALRHLSTCAECRREVEQLSQVADELLLLAPVQEPPSGFESRVVDAMGLQKRQPAVGRRWFSPGWLAPRLGPALAAVAVTAAVLIGVYQDDRRPPIATARSSIRRTASTSSPNGSRMGRAREGGVAFGYQGRPSWLFITVNPAHRDDVTRAELLTQGRGR